MSNTTPQPLGDRPASELTMRKLDVGRYGAAYDGHKKLSRDVYEICIGAQDVATLGTNNRTVVRIVQDAIARHNDALLARLAAAEGGGA